MHLSSLSTWTQRKGNCPLPLQPIPKTNSNRKTNSNPKNKNLVVYTEDLTDP